MRELFGAQWPGWRWRLGSLMLPHEGVLARAVGAVNALLSAVMVKSSADALLHNLVDCRAHREVLRTASRLVLDGRFGDSDVEARRAIRDVEDVLREAAPGGTDGAGQRYDFE